MRVDSLTEIEVEKAVDGTVTLTRRPADSRNTAAQHRSDDEGKRAVR